MRRGYTHHRDPSQPTAEKENEKKLQTKPRTTTTKTQQTSSIKFKYDKQMITDVSSLKSPILFKGSVQNFPLQDTVTPSARNNLSTCIIGQLLQNLQALNYQPLECSMLCMLTRTVPVNQASSMIVYLVFQFLQNLTFSTKNRQASNDQHKESSHRSCWFLPSEHRSRAESRMEQNRSMTQKWASQLPENRKTNLRETEQPSLPDSSTERQGSSYKALWKTCFNT